MRSLSHQQQPQVSNLNHFGTETSNANLQEQEENLGNQGVAEDKKDEYAQKQYAKYNDNSTNHSITTRI